MREFIINRIDNIIYLKKDNDCIAIRRGVADDIWFSMSTEEIPFEIKSSRNNKERETFLVLENLMKSIIGRYMLNGDYDEEYSCLPKDFIDLENKTIIWHSDGGRNSILKLKYDDYSIKISISGNEDAKGNENNAVRIRTSGSNYECYYKEFIHFFRQLADLEERLNQTSQNTQQEAVSQTKIMVLSKGHHQKTQE